LIELNCDHNLGGLIALLHQELPSSLSPRLGLKL